MSKCLRVGFLKILPRLTRGAVCPENQVVLRQHHAARCPAFHQTFRVPVEKLMLDLFLSSRHKLIRERKYYYFVVHQQVSPQYAAHDQIDIP